MYFHLFIDFIQQNMENFFLKVFNLTLFIFLSFFA